MKISIMKKVLCIITIIILIITLFGCNHSPFSYEVLDDTTVKITGYKGNDEKIIIPETTDGYKVTVIGKSAFLWCKSTDIMIPDSVTCIEERAFNCCINLKSMTIPNSVTTIGEAAFAACDNLENIMIPDSVTSIGNAAFSNCDFLKNMEIPNSVTTIGDSMFSYCENLQYVSIPDSVKNIGDYAFESCENLNSVTIPDSVINIGQYAFNNCKQLKSVIIPRSVENIGGMAFGYYLDEKIDDFTIYGYSDTDTEFYAKFWGFKFIPITGD